MAGRYDYDLPGPFYGWRMVPLPGGVELFFWPTLAVTATLPLLWLWLRIQPRANTLYRRLRHLPTFDGHCHVCRYDLRATPDPDGPLQARCPECGTPTLERRRPTHYPLPPSTLRP